MNILITGGCGFIGVNLIKSLISPDNQIKIIDDCTSGSFDKLRKAGIEVGYGHHVPSRMTIKNLFHLSDNFKPTLFSLEDIDVVIHLAAETGVPQSVKDPIKSCDVNICGTLELLEASRKAGVKRFVFASSSAVPGDNPIPYHEEMMRKPISPYGVSKACGEMYCQVYAKTYGLETVILRFSNVYGPHSENKTEQFIPKSIMRALRGEPIEIYGDGNQTRDFCYVDDLIDAIKICMTKEGLSGDIFQIATGEETSITKIAQLLSEHIPISFKLKPERQGDVYSNRSDPTKAKRFLGWKAKTSIEDGIRKTVEWFINEKDTQ